MTGLFRYRSHTGLAALVLTLWLPSTAAAQTNLLQSIRRETETLRNAAPERFQVRDGVGDGAKKGALIGLGIGLGVGVIGFAAACAEDDSFLDFCSGQGFLLMTGVFGGYGAGIGAGIGLVADALHDGRRDVWRKQIGKAEAGLAPVVSPRISGMRIGIRW